MSLANNLVQRKRRTDGSNEELNNSQPIHESKKQEKDPESDQEGEKLTLLEQVWLLGLKDSQVLRGCILMELSLRGRIATTKESRQRAFEDRIIEVVDEKITGEPLLDEALRLMKTDKQSVGNWIDLMSGTFNLIQGETWNIMKIGYQLKQVRERIAKGLVDKGILRTEKKNFVLFDMATHPLTNSSEKAKLIRQVTDCVMGRGSAATAHVILLVCAAQAANVVENAFTSLSFSQRGIAYQTLDGFYKEHSQFTEASRKLGMTDIIAGVLCVYSRLDTLL